MTNEAKEPCGFFVIPKSFCFFAECKNEEFKTKEKTYQERKSFDKRVSKKTSSELHSNSQPDSVGCSFFLGFLCLCGE